MLFAANDSKNRQEHSSLTPPENSSRDGKTAKSMECSKDLPQPSKTTIILL
jgi:hypothetical protein